MKSNLTILFIDDIRDEVEPFIDYLKNSGHDADNYAEDPYVGVQKASHKYDLIFIDFTFERKDIDGTQVGLLLRKKCPLVPLVLLTAYGREKIREFIYVGFDDYFDKHIDGEKAKEKKERLSNCLSTALRNSQRRIKSEFTHDELSRAKLRLDALQHAYTVQKRNRSASNLAKRVFDYECEKGIIFKTKDKKGETKSISGQTLHGFFRFIEKGHINENALKAKQLLSESKDAWPDVRTNFKHIKELIEEFGL